jgi:hypothetical protein
MSLDLQAGDGMATVLTAEQISAKLLDLLPPDGSPVLNRVMRLMLQRELSKPVSRELYSQVLDSLETANRIGRLRGQGGQIFLAGKELKTHLAEMKPQKEALSEAKLMVPLKRYLEGPFRDDLALPEDRSIWFTQDTSAIGPRLGRWARPDFILLTAMQFDLLPGYQVDVHSFELKTEIGANNLAVYEALAQTRFTHFGHLVWQLPARSTAEKSLPEIEKQCAEHGIGLILMREPNDIESYEIRLDPNRKETLTRDVDGFLESRLSDDNSRKLREFLEGGRI